MGCIRPPRALARYGSSWRTSRTRPPRPDSIRSGALPAQRASRASRCPASARRDGPHPVMWPCERPPRRGARGLPRSSLPRTALCYVIMGNQWVADFSQFRARRCGSHLAPLGGQAARGLRGLAPSGRVPFPPSVSPAPPAAARAPVATARIRPPRLPRRPASGPRVPRCPARPCATSSWATSGWPTSPSFAPAAAARIWLLLADKPHAASAAWLHQVGCPSRPACLPRLPLPRERPPRRDASTPPRLPLPRERLPRRGASAPPGDSASTPPGATPASLPPLPGAPRRGAARRRSSPRLGRSSAPRWWGSP